MVYPSCSCYHNIQKRKKKEKKKEKDKKRKKKVKKGSNLVTLIKNRILNIPRNNKKTSGNWRF